jgi:hypothetical protein
MKNAYEYKEILDLDGKCLRRERAIGGIVVWAIVAILALLLGKPLDVVNGIGHLFRP